VTKVVHFLLQVCACHAGFHGTDGTEWNVCGIPYNIHLLCNAWQMRGCSSEMDSYSPPHYVPPPFNIPRSAPVMCSVFSWTAFANYNFNYWPQNFGYHSNGLQI